jgi:hypothetical protein
MPVIGITMDSQDQAVGVVGLTQPGDVRFFMFDSTGRQMWTASFNGHYHASLLGPGGKWAVVAVYEEGAGIVAHFFQDGVETRRAVLSQYGLTEGEKMKLLLSPAGNTLVAMILPSGGKLIKISLGENSPPTVLDNMLIGFGAAWFDDRGDKLLIHESIDGEDYLTCLDPEGAVLWRKKVSSMFLYGAVAEEEGLFIANAWDEIQVYDLNGNLVAARRVSGADVFYNPQTNSIITVDHETVAAFELPRNQGGEQ